MENVHILPKNNYMCTSQDTYDMLAVCHGYQAQIPILPTFACVKIQGGRKKYFSFFIKHIQLNFDTEWLVSKFKMSWEAKRTLVIIIKSIMGVFIIRPESGPNSKKKEKCDYLTFIPRTSNCLDTKVLLIEKFALES